MPRASSNNPRRKQKGKPRNLTLFLFSENEIKKRVTRIGSIDSMQKTFLIISFFYTSLLLAFYNTAILCVTVL